MVVPKSFGTTNIGSVLNQTKQARCLLERSASPAALRGQHTDTRVTCSRCNRPCHVYRGPRPTQGTDPFFKYSYTNSFLNKKIQMKYSITTKCMAVSTKVRDLEDYGGKNCQDVF